MTKALPFSNLSSLQQRVLSSCIMVPTFMLSIYFGGVLYFVLISVILFIAYDEWSKMADKSKTKTKDCLWGSAYLTVGLATLFLMRVLPTDAMLVTLALFFIIWSCDTGAYFSGRKFGKKKLCPTISPGKTWAGFIGGLVAGGFVGYLCHHVLGIYHSVEAGIFIGAFVALTGQAGDLIISKYKRYVGVKDTGTIIPGHGGVLDRMDSLLLAAPVYLICIIFLHHQVA